MIQMCNEVIGDTYPTFVPQLHLYQNYAGKCDGRTREQIVQKVIEDVNLIYNGCGGRPVYLGEWGRPATISTGACGMDKCQVGGTCSVNEQAEYFGTFLTAVRDIAGRVWGLSPWQLNDSGVLDDCGTAREICREDNFGLIRARNGAHDPKPAAYVLADFYGASQPLRKFYRIVQDGRMMFLGDDALPQTNSAYEDPLAGWSIE